MIAVAIVVLYCVPTSFLYCHVSFMYTASELCALFVVMSAPQSTAAFTLSYIQWPGRTALMLASEGDHLDVVRELLMVSYVVSSDPCMRDTMLH